ncbi:hypothetical protein SCHIN_v1c10640 [Spiroplasma chinense]|uniref:ABC transporter permease n=1 Tax=Spiroplasma chinense TaxID=216932 RepID=A0A5B9Y7G1_9MOLU|nr:hypothetical protein [Spiroplasma chinense]QEH62257.1 hypothetical protein SCHIN_v1c10640 [Spiroplasma chinense]
MKDNLKIINIMFKVNMKKALVDYTILITISLLILNNVVFPVIINQNYRQGIISGNLNVKMTFYIKTTLDILFLALLNLFVISLFWKKQYDDGVHNVEKRLGVKTSYMFFLRMGLSKIITVTTILISFLIFFTISSIMDNTPKELVNTKFISVFGFYYLVDVLFFTITMISILTIHYIAAMFVSIFIPFILVLTPMFYSKGYTSSYDNVMKYRDELKFVAANIRTKLGFDFNDFLEKNNEYSFFQEQYNGLDIRWHNSQLYTWDLYEREFYFGDVYFPNIATELEKNSPDIYSFFKSIDDSLYSGEWQENCNKVDLMFNYGKRREKDNIYSKGICDISRFSNYLISKNIEDGKFNSLFKYISNSAKGIQIYNELDEIISFSPGTRSGTIFAYGHVDENQATIDTVVANVKTPMQTVFNWYFLNLLKSSYVFDNYQVKAVVNLDKILGDKNLKNKVDIFRHFEILWAGKSYTNPNYDDIWNLSGELRNSFLNSYLKIELPDAIARRDTSLQAHNFIFTSETSELSQSVLVKQSVTVVYEAMFITYFTLFLGLNFITYFIYERKWK